MPRFFFHGLFLGLIVCCGWLEQSNAQQPGGTKAPSSTPSPADSSTNLLAEANDLLRAGKFEPAIQQYQKILQATPNVPAASIGLTRAYLKVGKVTDAYDAVSKGLQIVDVPSEHVALGEVYFRQGKIVDAEREWVKVINSGHGDARSYLGVARVRQAISLRKQAKAMIDKAHELDPNDPDVQRFWVQTLNLTGRVENLEARLAGKADSDEETRTRLQRELDYLTARQKDPNRNCHLTGAITATETPLDILPSDPNHIRGYSLTVVINGRKSRLMLDTGASGILVDRGVAEKAGVTKLSETRIGGIGDQGDVGGYVALADTLKIGELEFKNCPVEVLDKRSVLGDDGLIGADVFAQFLVDLNFPEEKLKLQELPKRPDEAAHPIELQTDQESAQTSGDQPEAKTDSNKPVHNGPQDRYIAPEMKSYTQVFRFGHMLLVPTQVNNIPSKLFLIDTGGFMDAISLATAREVTKVHEDANMSVTGLNGRVKQVYSADRATLQFGHLTEPTDRMTTLDLSSLSQKVGTEVSGILGFITLNQLDVKIDYRDGLVDFEYKPR
jgi:tetratricopeptide (TPR) repeat protein